MTLEALKTNKTFDGMLRTINSKDGSVNARDENRMVRMCEIALLFYLETQATGMCNNHLYGNNFSTQFSNLLLIQQCDKSSLVVGAPRPQLMRCEVGWVSLPRKMELEPTKKLFL